MASAGGGHSSECAAAGCASFATTVMARESGDASTPLLPVQE
jgi:hypothetical protein